MHIIAYHIYVHAYIFSDLLARFQLWTTSNKIIKLCHLPLVSSLNQQSTRIHVNCHRCNRPLQRVGWLCDRCKLVINNCSVWWVVYSIILSQTKNLKLIISAWNWCLFSYFYKHNDIQGFNEVEAYCLYWKIFEKMHSDFCKISLTTEPVIHDFKLVIESP